MSEGLKFDLDKVPLGLLPPDALIEIAKVLDFGQKKYQAWNWFKGIKYSRVYSAALRHLFSWWKGESIDKETSLSHLSHAACCILFLLSFELRKQKQLDDRPPYDIS